MHHEKQHMILLSKTQQLRSHQRPAAQIERAPGFDRCQPFDFDLTLFFQRLAQLFHGQIERLRLRNYLNGHSVRKTERRTQNLMPPGYFAESPPQRIDVKSAAKPDGRRHVVRWTVWLQFVEEPESLLRKRQRQIKLARNRFSRHRFYAAPTSHRLINLRAYA